VHIFKLCTSSKAWPAGKLTSQTVITAIVMVALYHRSADLDLCVGDYRSADLDWCVWGGHRFADLDLCVGGHRSADLV